MRKLLFISTHNLATNPRLVKEIKLALENNFKVDVICFEFKNWSYSLNLDILKSIEKAWVTVIPANRTPFWPWIKSVISEKILRSCARIFKLKKFYLAQAASRRTILLLKAIRDNKGQYDLVIAHNYGAMYPAVVAAQKFGCKCGFDMEDYHPGEGNDVHFQQLLNKLIAENLPFFYYVSFASPLIKKHIIKDLSKEDPNWFVVLNHFSKAEFIEPAELSEQSLRLIWFSQNINYGRGLEQIIPVVETYYPEIELTLIGNKQEDFYSSNLKDKKAVTIRPPMEQPVLHRFLSNFDVGLAIEPGKDENNLIAIGNKLLAYYQAGLFIIASDTAAHLDFFKDKKDIAEISVLDEGNLKAVLSKLLLNKAHIRQSKVKRFKEALDHNWESESQKLLDHWKKI